MPAEVKKELRLEIAHVLFMDVVGFSKLLINDQTEILEQLNQLVRETPHFREAEAAGKLIRLSTGDGMALVFSNSAEAPVECALEISKALKSYPQIQLRMGVHSGPVNAVSDVNDRSNVTGGGINVAQRVMDCGDGGHILLSKHVAEDLEQYRQWQPCLHDLGECEVKHGARVSVVNLYTDDLGNPEMPEKFKQAATNKPMREVSEPIGKPAALKWAMIGAMLLIVAAVAIAFLILRLKRSQAAATASTALLEKSIAVLPFENLSDDKQNAYFADGVQDEILTDLAKIADLKVISRSSVMQYKSSVARNLREIGKQLGVAHLLEGSVQRAGSKVRVNAQLIDTRTDAHLWANTYDRDLADIFAIQSEIAKTIADQLQAKLSPNEEAAMHRKPTTDMAAYDLYLRATEMERNQTSSVGSGGSEETKTEVPLLEEAVRRDPNFVPALCLLARAHLYLYWQNADHSAHRVELAKNALDAAARLQPDAGEVHLIRALLHYWGNRDYEPALAELGLARHSLPNDTNVLFYTAAIERRQGKWHESDRHFEEALAIDPRNIQIISELAGASYVYERRYADAAKLLDSTLAWKPLDFGLAYARAYIDLAWKGDLHRLKEILRSNLTKTADRNYVADADLELALRQRDYQRAGQVLAAGGGTEIDHSGFLIPRQWTRGIVARGLGDQSRANTALSAARQRLAAVVRDRPEDGKSLIILAQIDAAMGRKEEAVWEGEHALELLPVAKDALNGAQIEGMLASIYAQVGEKDRALDLLEVATRAVGGPSYGLLRLDEVWDPLRGDSRFEKIVASLAPK
jgi:TolB-like protein/class 3 adenylate cyclase/Flp pilus assembly protein TadD